MNSVETEIYRRKSNDADKGKPAVQIPKVNRTGGISQSIQDGRIDKLRHDGGFECYVCGDDDHIAIDYPRRYFRPGSRGVYCGRCQSRGRGGYRGRYRRRGSYRRGRVRG